jgi:hypothetical protein
MSTMVEIPDNAHERKTATRLSWRIGVSAEASERSKTNNTFRSCALILLCATLVLLYISLANTNLGFQNAGFMSHVTDVVDEVVARCNPAPRTRNATLALYVADPTVMTPASACNHSEPSCPGTWDWGDCAMIPLQNELRVQLMFEMLVTVAQICSKHTPQGAVPPMLAGGTLIGAVRDKGMQPWANDVDLDISPELFAKIDGDHALRTELFNAGYVVFKALGCGRICAHVGHKKLKAFGSWGSCGNNKGDFAFARGHSYVDLYNAKIYAGKTLSVPASDCKGVQVSDYLPPRPIEMLGHTFMVPAKPKTLFCKLWGDNWRIPIKSGALDVGCNPEPSACNVRENDTSLII